MSSRPVQIILGIAAVAVVVAVAVGAYFFVVKDDNSAATAHVRALALGDVAADGSLVNPRNFFSATTKEIHASVILDNVKPGMKISGRWYQLSTSDAGPDGQVVGEKDIEITSADIQNGQFGASFTLSSGNGIPEDSWLLRVFQDDKLVRTTGFIVTRAVTTSSPPPSTSPTASTTPSTYTVVQGDTLQTIAARFKPANEAIDAYVTRLATANQLTPTTALTAGKVLQIP